MALPPLIEIVPPSGPVRAAIAVPGSKSITNRALALAALAEGETTLEGALWSEDTQMMVECLQELGFMINVAPDPQDSCNRVITVYGRAGQVPRGGTEAQPAELFVGNAGTAARFLAALVCLGEGAYRLEGIPRMSERPQAALFGALRQLGYQIRSEQDKLPAIILGGGRRPGRCRVSIEESSQFASALLLGAAHGGWEVEITGENADESPYVAMTAQMVEQFPRRGGKFVIEPDASSGSYFAAAHWLLDSAGGEVRLPRWPATPWQVDARFPKFLPLPRTVSRRDDLGDSIMTAIVLAPFSEHPVRFTELGRLRVQECERVKALREELTKCGAKVVETGDELEVFPSPLHGAEIETWNDHRMAMCFATLGLKVSGIRLKNPACVKKTFPNFFQKLAAPPPDGLGAVVLDVSDGRRLTGDELFAE